MGKVKNVKCYNGGSEMLEDLRFDNLLAEARSESFRVRNIKEINKQFSEIDMEDIDSDYGIFWSSLIDYISVLAHKSDVQPPKKIKRDGGYAPFVPSTSLAVEECKEAIRTPSQPQFREKVMALLRTP
ncbi:hypothetical protein PVK06_009283 [Gossypium arboreum]|uniref:Uncharacterized protein n=1 Tax=Gossypium arboreum TaxID=29729 RepID=A0ABR0QM43_GOSAR|nr:hypothetical protein PVK06_009283 [Gossypium arboreum]